MARLTKIYTRKGDDGSTALGTGRRVPKHDVQVAAYGDVDELNAAIGLARAQELTDEVEQILRRVQSELLNVGGALCMLEPAGAEESPFARLVEERHVQALERECDALNADLGPLENFILPAGSPGAAALHFARTVSRRTERHVVALGERLPIPPDLVRYLNRLSDLLFIMARYENRARGIGDVLWDKSV
jgi:cob(I)alamin adenosyltransferase